MVANHEDLAIPRLIGVAQAAEMLDMRPSTIKYWIRCGRLRGFRVGPQLLKVREDDVVGMVQVVTPTQPQKRDRVST